MADKLTQARQIINEVDARMAELFEKRMEAARLVYEYKREYGLPIHDAKRERQVLDVNARRITDETLKGYYLDYLQHLMDLSKAYQYRLQKDMQVACSDDGSMAEVFPVIIPMNLGRDSYDIVVERGLLKNAGQHLNLNRRVLVVTDSGVPAAYAQCLAGQCKESVICTVEPGEGSKSLDTFARLLQTMLDRGFSRKDCVVAVGGGVVGDLAGFAASAYMRGIEFYNIPTTLLSQIDSSIGGKTAINFGGMKNIVGAFHQPGKVLIDPDLLRTLPPRQLSNGLAEAVKMSLTSDPVLFRLFEREDIAPNLDTIILRSLRIKKAVVEQDEREAGLRRILNFGHTVGHGIESCADMHGLYHGECVALGMLPMCGEALRPRVAAVLEKCGLYRTIPYDWDRITEAAFHDKKADGDTVTVVLVKEPGNYELKTMKCREVIALARACLEG